MVYVSGGFRTAHHIQHGSTSRNPHWGSALDAPEFIPGWLGWGLDVLYVDTKKIKQKEVIKWEEKQHREQKKILILVKD